MMNSVTIVGRLTKDVELRYTQNGVAVGNFTLASNRPFKNQNGEQEADFINCVAWRKQAENLATYMGKGNLVGVTGRIQTRTYEGQDGKTVFVTEVLAESVAFLESGKKQGQGNAQGQNQFPQQNQQQSNFQQQSQQQGNFQQQNQQQQKQGNFQQQNQQQGGMPNPYQQNQQQSQGNGGQMNPIDINDQDLPF